MKVMNRIAKVFFATALLLTIASAAKADDYNKATTFTFSAPVELPGLSLPAGTYVFKVADTMSNRNIVQVFDEAQKHVYATFITIPNWRREPADKTVVRFSETAAGAPSAIKEWFYPGDNYGFEFVYPKTRAIELAKASNQPVPSMAENLAEDITKVTEPARTSTESSATELKNAPVTAEEPNGAEVEIGEAFATRAPAQLSAALLPKTASMLPLLGLTGLFLISVGTLLWFFSKQTA